MRVAVVFESLFGNTHDVAEAIARGVTEAEPGAQVDLLRVGEATPERAAGADLLIVGGPTHIRGMTTGFSRKMGASAEAKKDPGERQELEPGAEGPGIRDWFHRLPRADEPRRAAAFDTRIGARMAGGRHAASRPVRVITATRSSPTPRASSSRTTARALSRRARRSGPERGVQAWSGRRRRPGGNRSS
jgi:hypothetical protein